VEALWVTLLAVAVVTALVLPWTLRSARRGHLLRQPGQGGLGIEGKERQPAMAIELVAAVAGMLTLVMVGALSDGDARLCVWLLAAGLPWLLLQLGALQSGEP
jgi:hypothetical protein